MVFVSEPDGVVTSIVCDGVFLQVEEGEIVMNPKAARKLSERLIDLAERVERRDKKSPAP